ncbi:hypothetical protein TU53_10050 [Bacillus cereus]|nr:hypothetical protein TU53_10050 [Bacillus cereus]OBZ59140.1 hypothetical protein UN66_09300 [Bacillus cereus]OJE19710.1 hypothetical protein BAQ45_17235 [Bacillus pacificus]
MAISISSFKVTGILDTLNLLQATASTSLATRPVFGDWEKSKSFLYLFQHSYVASLLVYTP